MINFSAFVGAVIGILLVITVSMSAIVSLVEFDWCLILETRNGRIAWLMVCVIILRPSVLKAMWDA